MYVVFKFREVLDYSSYIKMVSTDNLYEVQSYFSDDIVFGRSNAINKYGFFTDSGGKYIAVDLLFNHRIAFLKQVVRQYKLDLLFNL